MEISQNFVAFSEYMNFKYLNDVRFKFRSIGNPLWPWILNRNSGWSYLDADTQVHKRIPNISKQLVNIFWSDFVSVLYMLKLVLGWIFRHISMIKWWRLMIFYEVKMHFDQRSGDGMASLMGLNWNMWHNGAESIWKSYWNSCFSKVLFIRQRPY